MAVRQVSRKDENGRYVHIEVELTQQEIDEIATRGAEAQIAITARIVAAAVKKVALGYAQGRVATLGSYEQIQMLTAVIESFLSPLSILSSDALAVKEIYDYAEGKVAWALHNSRALEELQGYDPVLDNRFPS